MNSLPTCCVWRPQPGKFPGAHYRIGNLEDAGNWPMESGYSLGAVGAWNLLLRLGYRPVWLDSASNYLPRAGELLIAVIDGEPDVDPEPTLRRWIAQDGRLLGAGDWRGWLNLLGVKGAVFLKGHYPYSALAEIGSDDSPQILAPPRWQYLRLGESSAEVACEGRLAFVRGERQTPSRAFIDVQSDVPARLVRDRMVYWNGNPFSAFQAWLQGQEELSPWLNWRHRLFWLDEQAAWLGNRLVSSGLPPARLPKELAGTTVVLRHDLDYSRDDAYLDIEVQKGISAVHAILKDRNARYWIERLKEANGQESAFHYNTGRRRWLAYFSAWLGGRPAPGWEASRSAIVGEGLLRQVRWARRQDIGVASLHRHLGFLVYPEWIDAMGRVFNAGENVLGGSSLFRAAVLRWGSDRVNGTTGTLGEFPDVQFPYWFPCCLAHGGTGGSPLAGWESASIMEPEPELVEQLLDYPVAGLPGRVLTLNFHPAHAHGDTFLPGGSLSAFRRIIEVIAVRGVATATLTQVFERMNRWLG